MSGKVGDNLFRASGVIAAAAAGGGVSWQSVETGATFTAVAGNGYPVNTTAQACTVTLPASASVGDEIIFTDYARNFATNALTIDQNSLKYQGQTSPNPEYDTAGESIHIVYMDATNGWIPINDGAVADEVPQTVDAEYVVVAGGGSGGGQKYGGGGGAGGYRTATLSGMAKDTTFTVTVGAGGAAVVGTNVGIIGSNSVFSTITSTYGGGGGNFSGGDALDGGSGGGDSGDGGTGTAGPGAGTAGQGYAGGAGGPSDGGGGGGGGASEVGSDGLSNFPSGLGVGGDGGDGTASSITGGSVTYAGGGGGASYGAAKGDGGAGGGGDGGSTANTTDATSGTANTGGGGGGGERWDGGGGAGTSGAGGSGIVILKIADTHTATFSGGVTSSLNTGVSGYKIYSITATSSTSETVTFS